MKKFTEFNFKKSTNDFIDINGFREATPIQEAVIPYVLKRHDVIGVSDTGTGKTHAFLIPIMEMIDSSKAKVQAVIITPTRELAMQTYQFAKDMKKADGKLAIYLAIGGKGKEDGGFSVQPQLVIATPGRLKDLFLKEQVLRLESADIIVLDEADMIFELGFLEDVDQVVSKFKKVQLLAFSATIPQVLKQFLKKYMQNPKTVQIEDDSHHRANVRHVLVNAKHLSYQEKLLQILPAFQPYVCLIFANTREGAVETAAYLRENGYDVLEVHADLSARQRKNALKILKNHEYTYIVATDVAARGIDIEGVTHVVSLGFPLDLNFYIHRSGRTGRNRRDGICYAIYKPEDEAALRKLQDRGIKFHREDYKNGRWIAVKTTVRRKSSKDSELEREISQTLKRKKKTVKPNYKKKQKVAVARIKQRRKREMIQEEIKTAQKERAKAKQKHN